MTCARGMAAPADMVPLTGTAACPADFVPARATASLAGDLRAPERIPGPGRGTGDKHGDRDTDGAVLAVLERELVRYCGHWPKL